MSAKKSASEKTASMTVRLDPKLKYGLEILARKQYRNLSSLVEWALNKVLNDPQEGVPYLDEIWDVDEPDRLVKLALKEPQLLTYDEQKIWKLVYEDDSCWEQIHHEGEWMPCHSVHHAKWRKIRDNWDSFVKVANGEANKSILPGEFEDEIPF